MDLQGDSRVLMDLQGHSRVLSAAMVVDPAEERAYPEVEATGLLQPHTMQFLQLQLSIGLLKLP